MKKTFMPFLLALTLYSCNKDNTTKIGCDIQQVYVDNANKVTITNGVWGTISMMEGNCMPTVPPSTNSCKNCPVKRTVKIYQYTLFSNATPSGNSTIFFDSFNTQLVAQVDADDNGFFQVSIPAGHYTIAIVENGKLYANGGDGQGGLSPFTLSSGTQNVNITITYKAAF
jgi:hypothetical protein